MEKSVETNFNDYMKKVFAMQEVDIREYSPLTLAYIGDSIYDLIIKSLVINRGNKQVQKFEICFSCQKPVHYGLQESDGI